MNKTVTIAYDSKADQLKVVPESLECSVSKDRQVKWESDLPDWRVVFGPHAPLNEQVASPTRNTLELRNQRAEDLRHVKYTVVAWTGKALKHEDPELIVET